MCGFAGVFWDNIFEGEKDISDTLEKMTSIIKHRGPDQGGVYIDDNVALGFRRLSIIDLKSGDQPMSYDDGRYTIVFNGEIYNYIELKDMLKKEGLMFSTNSDTEVILAAYKHMGREAVNHLRGMFSFIIWDKVDKKLFGARDPFGIKPLFYAEKEGCIYFASEKKSLLNIGQIDKRIDVESLHHYLTFQYVPDPRTILMDVSILEPGCTIEKEIGRKAEIKRYWNVEFSPVSKPMDDRVMEIRKALEDSVKVHMRSDVPVGAFLSGGIDSTIIATLASRIKPDIKTFTVGFEREGYSEIDLARETADELHVENISKVITAEEFMKELPKIVWHLEQPMADPSAIPLYFVAREARKHVKVVLSGEGADELFGGYNIYREPLSLKMFSYIPKPVRKLLLALSSALPEGVKGKSFLERGCTPLEKRYVGNANIFRQDEKALYLKDFNGKYSSDRVTRPYFEKAANYDDTTKMQYIDINTWLRGDILVKADRMTMANSLELRVPFLDKEVFKVASTLTLDEKVGGGTTKYALREAFKGIIPDSALSRKKLGFPVPIRHWLKDEMYSWAVELIENSGADRYINKQNALNMLEEHRKGTLDYSRRIWIILIFVLWHYIYIENRFNFEESTNYDEILREVAVNKSEM